MTIGNTTYIVPHVPLSSIPSSLNDIPPPHSCGPSRRNVATSHVCTASTRIVMYQIQVPPVVSGGHIPTYGVSHGTSYGTSHGKHYGL